MKSFRERQVGQFWRVHAPLIGVSATVMWGMWFVVFGNSWSTWGAAAVPVMGGIAYIYPWDVN